MENEQINPQLVIDSLSNQVASMARDIAMLQALNAQLRTKLAEQEKTSQPVLDN